jgi:hypothetical protein
VSGYYDHYDCVAILLSVGADSINIKNNQNLSARTEAHGKSCSVYYDWENLVFFLFFLS